MTTSQTRSFLNELAAGHGGPSIPVAKRAYFQQRFRLRLFNFILEKFLAAQQNGLTKAALARRIEKTPDQINRWLGSPSNLTADTMSDLLLGIAAEEFELDSSSPLARNQGNYSHYEDLRIPTDFEHDRNRGMQKGAAYATESVPQADTEVKKASIAGISDYGRPRQQAG